MTNPTWSPALLPLVAVCGWGIVVLVAEAFASTRNFRGIAWLAIVGLVALFGMSAWGTPVPESFQGVFSLDAFALYTNGLLSGLGIVALLLACDAVPAANIVRGEYYALMVFAIAGMFVMAAADDLILLFVGLETMSMAVYVLAGLRKQSLRSNEAALKYFLVGALASAILLYGIAMLYAFGGTTRLADLGPALDPANLDSSQLTAAGLGMVLVLAGFGFKVAAVPFHLWAPDVYEGAPTPVTAFMVTAVKAGGIAALIRTVLLGLGALRAELAPLIWVMAAATMTVGNLVALRQTSIKRMLAYSSVAHTGYLLVGLTAGTSEAAAAMLFYLAAYGVMNLGAFGVILAVDPSGTRCREVSDLAGLGRKHPTLAVGMAICMLSLLGMPPFGGFVGKVFLFQSALEAGYAGLVVVAIVNSVISAVYYIGVLRVMYFDEGGLFPDTIPGHIFTATVIAVVGTVWLGLCPNTVLEAARAAVAGTGLGG